jgi:hypothetical protein
MVMFASCPRCHRGELVKTEATQDLVNNANIVREGQQSVNRMAIYAGIAVLLFLFVVEILISRT